jgi:hypothetical protein
MRVEGVDDGCFMVGGRCRQSRLKLVVVMLAAGAMVVM